MNAESRKKISKSLSYVLRHQPDAIGIELDAAGWVEVEVLLAAMARDGRKVSRAQLDEVVATNDKQRFEFDASGNRIRARQGHSVQVDLGYPPSEPPELLYHGTADRNVESVRATGLSRAKRHAVHLSTDPTTAVAVGTRHGKPVVLTIRAGDMHRAGHVFARTGNDVWLTDAVPPQHIGFPDETFIDLCAGGVVVRRNGDRAEALLMCVRDEGYEIPKGHVEPGETLTNAAARETYEETGLTTELPVGRELGQVAYSFEKKGRTVNKRVHYFVMLAPQDVEPEFGKGHKRLRELKWVTRQEIDRIAIVNQELRAIVAAALDEAANP